MKRRMEREVTNHKAPVITIDGASGTGKGTVSQCIAKELGWNFLDSGVLYRVLAFAAEKQRISLENEAALATMAEHLDIVFSSETILFEGEEITDVIRTEKIGNSASKVGVFSKVRTALLSRQRAFQKMPGLVADGRDMGTVVFPDAEVKIFLTASPEERARRRYNQLNAKGIHVNLAALTEELRERDKRDQERTVAPLKPATDAVLINTDPLTIEEVVGRVMTEVKTIVK
ncbi:MAG: cmk [Gammaproteobacteria bacterium]|nr:cmk [Gammaproteobacteria bacterium]